MGERRNAASLFSHSLKTPLSSVKVGAQLLLKHLGGRLNDKDQQLLELILRNASTLEARINKLTEFSIFAPENMVMELNFEQLEIVHSLKGAAEPASAAAATDAAPEAPKEEPETVEPSKLVIHADPEIADLIPKFLDNRMKDIEALREALERGDFETIRTLGHMMKGAGGGYGFLGITEIGKMLEESARAGNAQDISRGIEALSAYMNSVEVVYDEL
jgi:signal transduction histidine kinase